MTIEFNDKLSTSDKTHRSKEPLLETDIVIIHLQVSASAHT